MLLALRPLSMIGCDLRYYLSRECSYFKLLFRGPRNLGCFLPRTCCLNLLFEELEESILKSVLNGKGKSEIFLPSHTPLCIYTHRQGYIQFCHSHARLCAHAKLE